MLVPAEELILHPHGPEAEAFLPNGFDGPPAQWVSVDEARRGIGQPHEWARYYQCFVVEGWERDLVVSCYFTLGVDDRFLYLQWTPCVLLPLPPEQRRVADGGRALVRRARRRSFVEFTTLPAGLFARCRRVVRRLRAVRTAPGEVAPECFGADRSVREMVGSTAGQWFQRSDAVRYVQLFDKVVIEAVRGCLEERGIAVAQFAKFAETVINNFGDVSNSVIAAGTNASASSGGTPAAPS